MVPNYGLKYETEETKGGGKLSLHDASVWLSLVPFLMFVVVGGSCLGFAACCFAKHPNLL